MSFKAPVWKQTMVTHSNPQASNNPEDKKQQRFLPDYTIIPDVEYSTENPCYWYKS